MCHSANAPSPDRTLRGSYQWEMTQALMARLIAQPVLDSRKVGTRMRIVNLPHFIRKAVDENGL